MIQKYMIIGLISSTFVMSAERRPIMAAKSIEDIFKTHNDEIIRLFEPINDYEMFHASMALAKFGDQDTVYKFFYHKRVPELDISDQIELTFELMKRDDQTLTHMFLERDILSIKPINVSSVSRNKQQRYLCMITYLKNLKKSHRIKKSSDKKVAQKKEKLFFDPNISKALMPFMDLQKNRLSLEGPANTVEETLVENAYVVFSKK